MTPTMETIAGSQSSSDAEADICLKAPTPAVDALLQQGYSPAAIIQALARLTARTVDQNHRIVCN
jgi:hypothetical protein